MLFVTGCEVESTVPYEIHIVPETLSCLQKRGWGHQVYLKHSFIPPLEGKKKSGAS